MTARMIALLVGAILLSGPAVASAASQDKSAAASSLEKRAEVARQHNLGRKLTASDYRQLSQQRARVQKLIDRLEAGQSVTPQEMDRAVALPPR